MRKELAGVVSAIALMTGAAIAQDTTGGAAAPAEPPAAEQPAPATGTETPPATGTDMGGQAAQTETPPADAGADDAMTAQDEPAMDAAPEEEMTAQDEPAAGSGTQVSVEEMVGRDVVGADGEPLGSVADVIIDPETGEMQQLVIASGGFLGIGEKQVAVDMADAEIRPNEGIFLSSVTQADIESMPEFDASAETESLDAPAPAAGTGGTGGTGMTPAPQ